MSWSHGPVAEARTPAQQQGDWDLHDPLGQGDIPMAQVLDTLLDVCPAATYTIENQDCAPSLTWLAEQGYLEERA